MTKHTHDILHKGTTGNIRLDLALADVVTLTGSQTLTNKTLTAPNISQVVFPATQVPSADANTLDDYEEGIWTPTFTFATPGDLSVTYGFRDGRYTKIGRLVVASFVLTTSAFTHTTASGASSITGLPFTSANVAALAAVGAMSGHGFTKAGYTNFVGKVEPGSAAVQLMANGSGVNGSNINAADMPTGGTVFVQCTVIYIV